METTFERFTFDNVRHRYAATRLSRWTEQAKTMRPVAPHIFEQHRYGIIAASPQGNVLGHVAVTHYEEQVGRVGALIVNPDTRREGIAAQLVTHILQTVHTVLPDMVRCEAYANATSLKVFEAVGGVRDGTRYPSQLNGCNFIVDLSHLVTGLAHE